MDSRGTNDRSHSQSSFRQYGVTMRRIPRRLSRRATIFFASIMFTIVMWYANFNYYATRKKVQVHVSLLPTEFVAHRGTSCDVASPCSCSCRLPLLLAHICKLTESKIDVHRKFIGHVASAAEMLIGVRHS